MILSDLDMLDALDRGEIDITPPVEPDQIQPASLDLRMGCELHDIFRDELVTATPGETLTIEPWTFYHGSTLDNVYISKRLTAQMTGRSSFGREGLVVHKTAGYVDPGWQGELTLEMFNFSLEPIEIEVGERVAQLIIMELATESTGYKGRYKGQTGAVGSRRREGRVRSD